MPRLIQKGDHQGCVAPDGIKTYYRGLPRFGPLETGAKARDGYSENRYDLF